MLSALTYAREAPPIPASCETELRRADRPARASAAAVGRRRRFVLADCCSQIRGDDGARPIGAIDDDVGGRRRASAASYGVIATDRKICSTDSGGACSRSRSAAAAAALNDHHKFAALHHARCPHVRANNRETRRLLTNRPGLSFYTKSPIPTNVYASAIGLCKDFIIMQSRKPSNSDF